MSAMGICRQLSDVGLVMHLFPPVLWSNIEDQYAGSWLISCVTARVLCDDTRPQNILNAVHIPLDVALAITGSAVSNPLSRNHHRLNGVGDRQEGVPIICRRYLRRRRGRFPTEPDIHCRTFEWLSIVAIDDLDCDLSGCYWTHPNR
jgi:hypothetical protein